MLKHPAIAPPKNVSANYKMTNKNTRQKTKSELIVSSIIYITIGLLTAFYYFSLDRKQITISDTFFISDSITSCEFHDCTHTGGYTAQCFFFKLSNYPSTFRAASSNSDRIEKILRKNNFVKITIEKTDTLNLKTNTEIQILSLELNNEVLTKINDGINSRNIVVSYLLPLLSFGMLLLGMKGFYKLLK